MSSHVHEAIRQARLGAGLSLRTLAGTLDVSRDTGRTRDVVDELGVVVDDLHATATEHVARPHEQRIADAVRRGQRLLA